jgi:exosortase family protein XrtF
LKEYLLQYKSFLLFLAKFFVTYLVLSILYAQYLNQFDAQHNQVDDFTTSVANQTQKVLMLFDTNAHTASNDKEPSIKLFYNQKWVSRVIEGCNALSIMILFVSFIIAFSGKWKSTLLFIFSGLLIIHLFNVLRIALLSMAVYHFPQYQDFLHSVVFPLFIYGVVFVLWIIWVNKFSSYAKK